MTKMEEIAKLVADHFGINIDQIKSKRRDRPYIQARHLTSYFIYSNLNVSLNEVGRFIGGRDHTTVIHARTAVENSIACKDYLYDDYVKLLPIVNKMMSAKNQIVVELPITYDIHHFCRMVLREFKDAKIEVA